MKHIILTIIKLSDLPDAPSLLSKCFSFFNPVVDGRATYLRNFTALSCKFNQYPQAGALADAAGIERQSWEWLSFRNLEQAKKEGAAHGKAARKHQSKMHWANGEAEWAGTGKFPKTFEPYKSMEAYIDAFKNETDSKLTYNGFSWAVTSDGRRLHDKQLIRKFDAWGPMNYGTSRTGIIKFWTPKCFKYGGVPPVIPMVGVGRIGNDGQWGFWDTHKHLLTSTPVDGVAFFFGNGAKSMMLEGNAAHPPLVKCAEELRQIWAEVRA